MKVAPTLILFAGMASAQEAVRADNTLSDEDFYRIVSCAAPIGGGCQKDLVRWSPADAQDVSFAIVTIADGYPEPLARLADTALDAAIAEVNSAGANLRLTRSEDMEKADIKVYLLAITDGDRITGTGRDPLDGTFIQAARTQLWWRADRSIIDGVIVFAMDVPKTDIPSIMLEEVTQAMGLLTDIEGRYYETRSIFSETSNKLTQLGPQDAMALRRHYP